MIHAALGEDQPAGLTRTSPTVCQSVSESPVIETRLAFDGQSVKLTAMCRCLKVHTPNGTEVANENKEMERALFMCSRTGVLDGSRKGRAI